MKHRLNGVKKNKLIIFASIFAIACISLLSVGYAANSSTLAFDGSAFARAEGDTGSPEVQIAILVIFFIQNIQKVQLMVVLD